LLVERVFSHGSRSKEEKKGGIRDDCSTSFLRSHKVGTRETYEVELTECSKFKDTVLDKDKEAFKEVEATMVVKREQVPDTQILEEAWEWVEDPIHS